jgi:hypothetical protein
VGATGGAPIEPVLPRERHPRARGFRDGLLVAAALLAIALAAGILVPPGSSPAMVDRSQGPSEPPTGPTGSGRSAAVGAGTNRSESPSPSGPDLASPPQVANLTVVWITATGLARGTDMRPGCTFSFGGGVGVEPIWETCPGPEGPTDLLGVLYADPGVPVSIENSTFTPSTDPNLSAVGCGSVSAGNGFLADPSCQIGYAEAINHEYTFRVPTSRGVWVLVVRGCLRTELVACGAWYAEVDTRDPPPSPY